MECNIRLKVFFVKFKAVLRTFRFEDVTDGWRSTEENGHFSLAIVVQLPKHLYNGRNHKATAFNNERYPYHNLYN